MASAPSTRQDCNRVADSLQRVTDSITAPLSGRLAQLYEVGNQTQHSWIDLIDAAVRLDAPGLLKPSVDVIQPWALGLAELGCCRTWQIDWQELRNKVDIYDLVLNVERRIAAPDDLPITHRVDRAYELGDFHALWAVEGLGHDYAMLILQEQPEPDQLLAGPNAASLPVKSLSMMNAGMGLAFAETVLNTVEQDVTDLDLVQRVDRFVRWCQRNATEGYQGAALESLGLVTQTYHRPWVARIDRVLTQRQDEALLGYFWHGVGRARYFALRNFLPCRRVSWTRLVNQASHAIGKRNLVGGMAWAITLVNMRWPQVMQQLLRKQANQIERVDPESFIEGVRTAIIVRHHSTPGADFLSAFCHPPTRTSEAESVLWDRFVGQPCRQALIRNAPSSRKHLQLGPLFRIQRLDKELDA